MPAVKQLLDDPRYEELNWEGRQIALQRFSETDDGRKVGSEMGELGLMEKLRYFADNGTQATKNFNASAMEARFDYGQTRQTAPIKAESDYKIALDEASSAYRAEKAKRAEDLFQADKLTQAQKTTGFSLGTVVADVVDTANPFSVPSRLAGNDTAHQERHAAAVEEEREATAYLQANGFGTEADMQLLQDDAALHENAGGAPAAVDTYGEIAINDGTLVTDIQAVYDAIDLLDAPDSEKRITRNSLELRKQTIVENSFEAAAKADMVSTEDKEGGNREVSISRLFTLGRLAEVAVGVSPIGLLFGDLRESLEDRATTGAETRSGRETHTYAEKAKAVNDWVASRDGVHERFGLGFAAGATTDVAQMFTTPLEILGVDFATNLNKKIKEDADASAGADRLANLGLAEQVAEVVGRVIPQVVLTRATGSAAGGLVKGTTAAANARRAQIASRFAVGFGGLQSATFNARSVLDNGGTEGEAVFAGLAGFATTFLVSSGFNKIGAGGVEQFHAKAAANATALRSGMLQRMGNIATGVVGEGVEEFVDEFVNGMITADATGSNPEDIAHGALIGGLVGMGTGAGFGAIKPVKPTLKTLADRVMKEKQDAILNPESDESKATAAKASRIVDLRDKADSESGLTEAEVIELENLEKGTEEEVAQATKKSDLEYLGTKQEEVQKRLRDRIDGDTELSNDAINNHIEAIDVELLSERDDAAETGTTEPIEEDELVEPEAEASEEVAETSAETVVEQATDTAEEEVPKFAPKAKARPQVKTDETARIAEKEVAANTIADPKFVEESTVEEFTDVGVVSGEVKPISENVERTDALNENDSEGHHESITLQIRDAGIKLPKASVDKYNKMLEESESSDDLEVIEEELFIELKEIDLESDVRAAVKSTTVTDVTDTQKTQDKVDLVSVENEATKDEAKASNSYGKSGIPKKYFTRTPTDLVVEQLENWTDNKRVALENYSEKSNVDLNEEDIRAAEIQNAEDLLDVYYDAMETDKATVEERSPTAYYGGMMFLAPEVLIPALKNIWKTGMSLVEFSKQAILSLGASIRPALQSLHSLFASKDGDVTREDLDSKPSAEGADVASDEIKTAEKKVEEAEEMDDKAEEELLEIAGVQAYRAQRGDNLLKRIAFLPYSKLKEIASRADGTDGTVFGRILGVPALWVGLGITSKAAAIKVKKFYTDAQAALQLGVAMAEPTAQAEVDALRAHFRDDVFQYNPDGTVVGVEVNIVPFEHNGETITTSSRLSDIIEAVIKNPADPKFSDELREFAAEWVALRNHTLGRAKEAGVSHGQLFDESRPIDYSKLKEGETNVYSPRGPVSDSNDDSNRASGTSSAGSQRSSFKRQFSSEAQGVSKGMVYEMGSPFDRMQQFVSETNKTIAMENFRRDPDVALNQQPLAIEKVTEYETLDTGDVATPVPVIKFKQTKRSKLADTKISMGGGKSFNYRNDDSADLQDVFNGFIHPSNSKMINRSLKRLGVLKGLRLVLDGSFLGIQLFGLSRGNPLKWFSVVGKSLHSLIDGDQVRLDFLERNPDLIQDYVKSGGMYSQRVDELLSIQTRTTSKLRKNTVGRLEDSMMNALMIGSIYQFEALRSTHLKKGTLTAEMDASFARMADRSVGREDMTRNGVSYDKQLWMRTAGTAPSMYSAFVNGFSDLASSDPVIAKAAWKAAGKMGTGTIIAFIGASLAAAWSDEDDTRTAEEVISDAAKRMLPWQDDFMRVEVPIGDRYTIVSDGGFYRGFFKFIADFGGAVAAIDPSKAIEAYTSFLNSKKAPGLATLLELYTGTDYFGNEISKTETILQSVTPVSVEPLREKVIDVPVMTLLGFVTGNNIRSNTNIQTEELGWDETLRQTAFGLVGTSNFLESEARVYKRQLNNFSNKLFGRNYEELTPQEQYRSVVDAEGSGVVKPDYTGDIGRYRKYLQTQFESNTRNPNLSVFLIENKLMDKVISIPKSSITFGKDDPKVPIPKELYKSMVKQYHSEVETYLSTEEARSADPKVINKAVKKSWENILRSKDYH